MREALPCHIAIQGVDRAGWPGRGPTRMLIFDLTNRMASASGKTLGKPPASCGRRPEPSPAARQVPLQQQQQQHGCHPHVALRPVHVREWHVGLHGTLHTGRPYFSFRARELQSFRVLDRDAVRPPCHAFPAQEAPRQSTQLETAKQQLAPRPVRDPAGVNRAQKAAKVFTQAQGHPRWLHVRVPPASQHRLKLQKTNN
jgi:hypothetical protein